MTEGIPTLVVVGRVNRGKSSILSTLCEDDSVRIAPTPGTTIEARSFPLVLEGRPVLQIVDTPGFEDAAALLALLREGDPSPAQRPGRIREFIRQHRDGERFGAECRLLDPVMNGGAIMYVVDGSVPYRGHYEAEMEILRWTGQPSLAVINRIRSTDHSAEWKEILNQYFSLVRSFNALSAGYTDRLGLMEALREVREEWRSAFDAALAALRRHWAWRHDRSARILTDLLASALIEHLEIRVGEGENLRAKAHEAEGILHDRLRALEQHARKQIEETFKHHRLERLEAELPRPMLDEDLFSQEVWRALGLTRSQLVAAGAASGAVAGAGLDAVVGGLSLGTGAVLGSLVGSGASLAWLGRDTLRKWTHPGSSRGPRLHRAGPIRQPDFPWVLLDRALIHFHGVRHRAHGRRDAMELKGPETAGSQGIVSGWSLQERSRWSAWFRAMGREGSARSRARLAMEEALKEVLKSS